MDFLFAIPSFIFHLVSTLFSWIFSVILGIVGIALSPFKLARGLLMGVDKALISIVLLPTLLFSHPGDISATQPVVGTSATVPNTYNLEKIYNDISQLEEAGRNMEPLRNRENLEKLRQCGDKMREYQSQAEKLVEITEALPMPYNIALGAAARSLNSCVSCTTYAKKQCEMVRVDLSDYQSMMNEE
ncbi:MULTISPECIES: hypothetical protein [unclassified Microcoleus]|uniref:hypothetical protein n=1 Tax=unclassified Microcoleus TaxID=2642155 RepID=UPI002FD043C0